MEDRVPDLGRRGGCTIWFIPLFLVFAVYSTAAAAMGDNLIAQVLDQLSERLRNFWDWVWDPLWRWYLYLFLFFLFLLVIGYFLPFKWVRAAMGFALALAVAFVAGGRQMRETYKDRLQKERDKVKQLEAEKRQRRDQGNGGGESGGGFWPFNWR